MSKSNTNIDNNNDNNQNKVLTAEMLAELNECALTHEEIFNNSMSYATYQEDLLRNTLFYNIAEELLLKINTGYILNLNNEFFIKNLIILYQYGDGDIYQELFDKLPTFLKIILNYHLSEEVPMHFWMSSLNAQITITHFMDAFNLQVTEDKDLGKNRLILEPYCIALDAALQQFDFDTGQENEPHLFSTLVEAKAIYLSLQRAKVPYAQNIELFTTAYPYSYRFLIEAAISIDYGCFLNGLITLQDMVFGGPSDAFVDQVIKTILKHKAYTIPFSNHSIVVPAPSPFPTIPPTEFYTPFTIAKVKTAFDYGDKS